MYCETCLSSFVKNFLPPTAELLWLKKPYKRLAIITADLDGDKKSEIIAAYKLKGECYVVIIKNYKDVWCVAASIKGKGYDINYLNANKVEDKQTNNLIIGWQVGAIWAELDIFQWTEKGLKNILNEDIPYSKIQVKDMVGDNVKDGKAEIALWKKDTGKAYKVEVLRWDGKKLVPALDVYRYYFKRVVSYYENRVKELPEAAFYWYYLADAQLKAEMPEKALRSVHMAMKLVMKFKYEYPSEDDLIKLERKILEKLQNRSIKLYPASVKIIGGVKWGFINNNGDFLIKPIYTNAYSFQDNNLAIVQENNLYGVIDETGKYVIQPKYDTINQFSEGRASVVDSSGFKVIDEKGIELTKKSYSFIGSYSEGMVIAVRTNTEGQWLYGYLDKEGNEVISLNYKDAGDFKNGKAVVKIDEGEYALINTKGQKLNTYKYAFVGQLNEGLLAFKENEEGKYGYIDESGNVVIPTRYTSAQPFNEGRAVVNVAEDYGNSYGVIDRRGNFIIMPKYNDVNLLGESMISLGIAISKENPRIGSKYAIANADGKLLTDFIYYGVSNYSSGFASAYDSKYTFFIDRTGMAAKGLPKVEGSGVLSFEGDLIRAEVDQRLSYYSKMGKVIFKQNTVIPLNNQYAVKEEKYKPNKDYLVYYPQVEGMKNKQRQKKVNIKLKELSQVKPIDGDIQLEYSYTGDFSVEFFRKNLLVLELVGYQYYFGAAHGMPTRVYANVDLVTGLFYQLKDLFKKNSNHVKVLSDIIEYKIKNDKQYEYVWLDSYKGIKEDQPFYVKDDALYIYFNVYEIAPYVAGTPTFKIDFKDIMNIIDTNGDFWRSFN